MFGVTNVHPIALFFTILMSLVAFFSSRKFILFPFLLVGVFVTVGQRITLLGFDFTMLRIIIFITVMRILLRNEYKTFVLNTLDKAFILYVVFDFFVYTLLRKNFSAFVNRSGFAYDSLGIYFVVRCSVRDLNDIFHGISIFAFICILLALTMTIEQVTGRNVFYIFGGVPEFTEIREGGIRSQGPFAHPLLAGAFGGTLLPAFWGLWQQKRNRLAPVAIFATVVIAITSASSGPVIAVLCGIIGLLAWSIRVHMREVRWIIICGIFGLSLIMKAPVWALIARLKLFGASTGYHRYLLIDQAIKRVNEWWLLGTVSTDHWGPNLWDITNKYIQVAVEGGFVTFSIFVLLIILAFRNIGKCIQQTAVYTIHFFVWTIGVSWFAHSMTFFGMTYFGSQILTNWLFILSAISIFPGMLEKKNIM